MKTPYTYTVLRYVHDTATGEFLNVGIVLYAPKDGQGYAGVQCRQTYARITSVFPGMDGNQFRKQMRQLQARITEACRVCTEELSLKDRPASVLPLVHQVLPHDASSLQWSPEAGGLTANAEKTLQQLYERLISRYDDKPVQHHLGDEDVWRNYKRTLEGKNVLAHFEQKKFVVDGDTVVFDHAWKNGMWHCLKPMSFDLASPDSMKTKAYHFLGEMLNLSTARKEDLKVYLLLGAPKDNSKELQYGFDQALTILNKLPVKKELITESEATAFSERLAKQVQSHLTA